MDPFNGLGLGLGSLSRLSTARTRSISAENMTGEKGGGGRATEGTGAQPARALGRGWKVSPSIEIQPGAVATLADILGAGAIQHLWLTTHRRHWRQLVLRMHWDEDERPAVEVPLGDFFCSGWGEFGQVSSLPVAVNPNGGFNCYWEMPFRRAARITIESLASEVVLLFYQIDYALTEVPEGAAYFHAQWRRSRSVPEHDVHTLLDQIEGSGHYVGTYLAWSSGFSGWWGEGEIKFYLDGDDEFPTICGTGTEDYFGGAWNFELPGRGYTPYTTPFLGLNQVLRSDGPHPRPIRFGMYRWHVMDPIRFTSNLRITIQDLGWRADQAYVPLQDDIASTAFWYQRETSSPKPYALDADLMEID